MSTPPEVVTIKCVLQGQGIVGRPARLELHEGDLARARVYQTFDSVPELSKWLSANGYAYVPGSHAQWARQ